MARDGMCVGVGGRQMKVIRPLLIVVAGIIWLEIFQPLYSTIGHPWEEIGTLSAMAIGLIMIWVGSVGLIRVLAPRRVREFLGFS
jgi:hypothetical protein